MTALRRHLAISTLVFASACADTPAEKRAIAQLEPRHLSFAVEGRSNGAPSAAGWGTLAAVVWSASTDTSTDIFVSVSQDGGTTFAPAARVNDIEGEVRASGEQAARVAIGPGNVLHVLWPARRDDRSIIQYASSRDLGRTFSKAATIAGGGVSGLRGWQSVALGYDGGVHAVWLDGRNADPNATAKGHQHHNADPRDQDRAPRQDVFHAAWNDREKPAEHLLAADVCFCCKTALATSGDRVYAAWRHIYPGSVRDIAVSRSADNGKTFAPPIRLSDDGWKIAGCPDDGPAMTADGHGGIHLAWPTLVSGETPRKAVFYAALGDHGGFTPRLRLDSGEADPAHPQIAADVHGTAAVVWDEHAAGRRAIVLREVAKGAPRALRRFEAHGATYPAIAAVNGHWILVWSAQTADGRAIIDGRQIPFAEH